MKNLPIFLSLLLDAGIIEANPHNIPEDGEMNNEERDLIAKRNTIERAMAFMGFYETQQMTQLFNRSPNARTLKMNMIEDFLRLSNPQFGDSQIKETCRADYSLMNQDNHFIDMMVNSQQSANLECSLLHHEQYRNVFGRVIEKGESSDQVGINIGKIYA